MLREFDATTVTMAVMLEPVTVLLSFVLLSATPSPLVVPGGAAILAGIYTAARSKSRAAT